MASAADRLVHGVRRLWRRLIGRRPALLRAEPYAPGRVGELPVGPPSWLVRHRLLRHHRMLRNRRAMRRAPVMGVGREPGPISPQPAVGLRPESVIGTHPELLLKRPEPVGGQRASTSPALGLSPRCASIGVRASTGPVNVGVRPELRLMRPELVRGHSAAGAPTGSLGSSVRASTSSVAAGTGQPPKGVFAHSVQNAAPSARSGAVSAHSVPNASDQPPSPGKVAAATRETPESRWRQAIAASPVESAQPLTGRWAPVARLITGRSETRYTSGPATRRALQAAGALGAATGTVIHLSRPPADRAEDAAVITHELAHSRTPVQRPRFLLPGGSGHDEEERSAHRAAASFTSSGPALNPRTGPRLVQRATSSDQVQREPVDAHTGTAPDVVSRYSSGLVDTLPVTGIGGLMEVARTATGPYFGTSPTGGAPSAIGLAAATGLSGSQGSGPSSWTAAGGLSRSPAGPDGHVALTGAGAQASPYAAQADPTVAGGAPVAGGSGGSAPAPGSTAAASAGAAAAANAPGGVPDLDRLLEALEDTVLRELERRGGRFEGVF